MLKAALSHKSCYYSAVQDLGVHDGPDPDSVQAVVVPVIEVDGKQHYDGEQPGEPLGNMTLVFAIPAAQTGAAQVGAVKTGAAETDVVLADEPQADFAWVV